MYHQVHTQFIAMSRNSNLALMVNLVMVVKDLKIQELTFLWINECLIYDMSLREKLLNDCLMVEGVCCDSNYFLTKRKLSDKLLSRLWRVGF